MSLALPIGFVVETCLLGCFFEGLELASSPCTDYYLELVVTNLFLLPPQLSQNQPIQCLLICCTQPLSSSSELTSLRDLCRAQIRFSWTSSALDAFKLPLFSATRKLSCYAETATSCFASQLEEEPDSLRDALTERRLIKN